VRASELAVQEMPAEAGLSKLNSVERRGRRCSRRARAPDVASKLVTSNGPGDLPE
jgi:hypothetical protein